MDLITIRNKVLITALPELSLINNVFKKYCHRTRSYFEKKSVSLEKVDSELRSLLDDMLETMYAAPGIGLAAVQVGILKRLVVIDISKIKKKKNPFFLINPEIISQSKHTSTS